MSTATQTSLHRRAEGARGLRPAARSGLDVMLTAAVVDRGAVSRFVHPTAAARTAAGLARHPRRTASDAAAPKALGSRKFKAVAKAPGTYVHAS